MNTETQEIDQHRLNQRLEGGLDNCLFCQSTSLSFGGYDQDTTTLYQNVKCNDCDKEWTDAYELNRVLYEDDSLYHTAEQKLDLLRVAAKELIDLRDRAGMSSANADFNAALQKIRESL